MYHRTAAFCDLKEFAVKLGHSKENYETARSFVSSISRASRGTKKDVNFYDIQPIKFQPETRRKLIQNLAGLRPKESFKGLPSAQNARDKFTLSP